MRELLPLVLLVVVTAVGVTAVVLLLIRRTDAAIARGVEARLAALDGRLDMLRGAVDARLGDGFRLVGEQLDRVQHGFGELQGLADGVGDLRRVLANVKTRGMLGEYRLEALLEQVLAPTQFARQVKPVPGSDAVVEFAVRLPKRSDAPGETWLPIDAKFPVEAYERLLAAEQAADKAALDAARVELASAVRRAAQDIAGKYVAPPHTTDYGVLFLPVEGLFAEVLRVPGLLEQVHRLRVLIAGPTTLAALLDVVQLGFRAVALEERSREIRDVLAATREEFAKFGEAVATVRGRLESAGRGLDEIDRRSRAMGRALSRLSSGTDDAEAT